MSPTTILNSLLENKKIAANSRDIIHFLSVELGERIIGPSGTLDRARDYIISRFTEQGSRPSLEEYRVNGHKVANIVCEIPGTENPDQILLIGAHYDTIEGTPGADDNASAIAGLLEMHRLLSEEKYKKTLRFVAFTLEEPPFFSSDDMGSMHHAKKCKKRRDNIELMICLEMLGYGGKNVNQNFPLEELKNRCPKGADYLVVVSLPSSAEYAYLWKRLYNANTKKPIYELIGPNSIPGIGFSDHYSFNKQGYPNIMLTDTAFYRNKNYHTENDTIDTINFKFLAENIFSSYLAVRELANLGKLLDS